MVTRHHLAGLPVLRPTPVYTHAGTITPAGPLGAVAHPAQRQRPSRFLNPVGPRIALFEACSAFTHVPACMFAKSPKGDPLHRRLRQLRYLHYRSDCYRLERPVAGWDLHPLSVGAFSRRTEERAVAEIDEALMRIDRTKQ
jgi:hypothetical protein